MNIVNQPIKLAKLHILIISTKFKTKPMNPHKQTRSSSQLHKIQLLESNTNRVKHQHQSLQQLLADNDKISRYRQTMDIINQTIDRFDRFKYNADRVLSNVCIVAGRYRWIGTDMRYEMELKDAQAELAMLRQYFVRRKKQQSYTSKSNSTSLQNKLSQLKQQNMQELQLLQKNVKKYLSNVKKQIIVNHEAHVMSYANNYLEEHAEAYCDDVQADIGLLMCELEYLLGRRNEAEVEKQMKGIKIQEKTKTAKNTQKQQESELGLGKLQRQVIYKKLNQFIPETIKRIAYTCHLLHKKIEQAISCLKSNNKSKHKNPTPKKYEQEQKQFTNRLHKIQYEIAGMKMKINHWQNKIKILDYKIRKLDQRSIEKEYSCGVVVDYGEIQKNFNSCKEKLEQFSRLKGQLTV